MLLNDSSSRNMRAGARGPKKLEKVVGSGTQAKPMILPHASTMRESHPQIMLLPDHAPSIQENRMNWAKSNGGGAAAVGALGGMMSAILLQSGAKLWSGEPF